jgi:hypothetical protein
MELLDFQRKRGRMGAGQAEGLTEERKQPAWKAGSGIYQIGQEKE